MIPLAIAKRPRRCIAWSAFILLSATAPVFAAGDVKDEGGMFSARAVEQARADVAGIERETNVPILIETIPSLSKVVTAEDRRKWKGKKATEVVDLVAERRDREQENKGVYVLMSKKPPALQRLHPRAPGNSLAGIEAEGDPPGVP